MNPGIFLRQDGGLSELRKQPYEAEELLQKLLADYPDLLAGDQMDAAAPRKWLFVNRELGVPSEEGGSGRWSLDHLFVDQDGIPTLVEVKRSSDTRIRREVVGQMLDYAANAVVYWPQESIRSYFEVACEARGQDPDEVVRDRLGDDIDPAVLWQNVATNLHAQRIRMVFVADVIPAELERIIEFLNGQMSPAEVLAVEIPQYVGEGLQALVPRVVGQTASAQLAKSTGARSARRQWDEGSFFATLADQRGDAELNAARTLYDWAASDDLSVVWGQGSQQGSFTVTGDAGDGRVSLISVWTNGRVEVKFADLAKPRGGFFQAVQAREELRDRLVRVPGVEIPGEARELKSPSIPLAALTNPGALGQFRCAIAWVADMVSQSPE